MTGCTDVYFTWLEPLTVVSEIVLLGVATGAISMLLTKATVFDRAHEWLGKKSPFLEEMLSCPWCTSHWVAAFFMLVYRPLLFDSLSIPLLASASPARYALGYLLLPVDWLVSLMVMVFVAALAARAIYGAYKPMLGE